MNTVTFIGLIIIEVLLLVFIISLIKSRRKLDNRDADSLTVFLLAFALWAGFNYLSNQTGFEHDHLLLINRLLFVFSVFLTAASYAFIGVVTKRLKARTWQAISAFAGGLVAAVISMTPLVVQDVYIDRNVVAVEFGNLIWLYFLVLSLHLLAGLYWLVKSLRSKNKKVRTHSKVLVKSLGLAIGLVALTNLLLPVIFGLFTLSTIGPLFSVLIVGGVSYAIMQHGLLDIKGTVVRSTAYLFVLITLALIYYVFAYATSVLLFGGSFNINEVSTSPINVVIALTLAFLFQPVKRFFDKLTDDLFYKDNYSSGKFYDDLNTLVRSTINLRNLLGKSANLIKDTLKAETVSFFVFNQNRSLISVGAGKFKNVPAGDVEEFEGYDEILLADAPGIEDGLSRMLISHRISVAVPLRHNNELIGVMCLGEHQSSKYSRKDIQLLKAAAGELAIGIQNALSVQEIRDLNENLQQRIDAATKELRRSNAQLQKLDEAKDEFISMASHQLRTPLTSIKGYLSMLVDGDMGKVSPKQKEVLEEALISSERMVRLIGDFLNVSRLQTGKFVIEKKPVDLAVLVENEIDSLEQSAASRNLKISYKKPSKVPVINIDEGKIQQVVMNFIDNAIFYSKEGGTITISLKQTEDIIEFTVKDTGIGVPEDEQAGLFSKFFRASNARTQRPDGTGVGIFLAKKVITDHGGEIIFSSREGKGSTFGFKLPVPKDYRAKISK